MDSYRKLKLAIGLLCLLKAIIGIQGEYTYEYLGCYQDKAFDRVLSEYWYKNNNKNTIEYCLDFCSQRGYAYAGLEYAHECRCGSSGYNKHGTGGGCTYKCTGNKNQICGGVWRLSVYAIAYLPEPIPIATPSPTTSVSTSPKTTASASSFSVTMNSETTPSTSTSSSTSTTTSVTAPTTSTTTTATANSLITTMKSETPTSPTNTTITTNTSMLPNIGTFLTNNSMVTIHRHADGNMSPDRTRGKGNRVTYICIGVGGVVVCAVIGLVVVLVVLRAYRRKGSDDKPRPTLTNPSTEFENVGEINESTRQDEMTIAAETVKYVNVNLQQMVGSADGTGSDYANIGLPADATYTAEESTTVDVELQGHSYIDSQKSSEPTAFHSHGYIEHDPQDSLVYITECTSVTSSEEESTTADVELQGHSYINDQQQSGPTASHNDGYVEHDAERAPVYITECTCVASSEAAECEDEEFKYSYANPQQMNRSTIHSNNNYGNFAPKGGRASSTAQDNHNLSSSQTLPYCLMKFYADTTPPVYILDCSIASDTSVDISTEV